MHSKLPRLNIKIMPIILNKRHIHCLLPVPAWIPLQIIRNSAKLRIDSAVVSHFNKRYSARHSWYRWVGLSKGKPTEPRFAQGVHRLWHNQKASAVWIGMLKSTYRIVGWWMWAWWQSQLLRGPLNNADNAEPSARTESVSPLLLAEDGESPICTPLTVTSWWSGQLAVRRKSWLDHAGGSKYSFNFLLHGR